MLDQIRLALLRSNQWVGDLSSGGRAVLLIIGMVLLIVVMYFGLLPSKHIHYNPHAIFSW
jgi:hypothetical protein